MFQFVGFWEVVVCAVQGYPQKPVPADPSFTYKSLIQTLVLSFFRNFMHNCLENVPAKRCLDCKIPSELRGTKGRFCKRMVLTNERSFRFLVSSIHFVPSFRFSGTVVLFFCCLIPGFRGTFTKTTLLGNHPFAKSLQNTSQATISVIKLELKSLAYS